MGSLSALILSALALVLWAAIILCADHDILVDTFLYAAIAVIVVVLFIETLW